MHMYADDKMRQNYNNFKQKNRNITIMSLNILDDFILRTGKSSEGQISVSF